MIDLTKSLEPEEYRAIAEECCREMGCRVLESDGDGLIVHVQTDSGRTRMGTLTYYDNYGEVCLTSSLSYEDWEDVPHGLCIYLMNQNFHMKVGYWCLAEAGGAIHVTVNERIPASLFDTLHLFTVLGVLGRHCDSLDQKVSEWRAR